MWNDRYAASVILVMAAVILAAREHSCVTPYESIPQVELKPSFSSDPCEKEVFVPSSDPALPHNPFAIKVLQVSLQNKETLNQKLKRMGLSKEEVDNAVKAINSVSSVRGITPKNKMSMTFEGDTLQKLSFYSRRDKVMIERTKANLFKASKVVAPVKVERVEGVVSTSLYSSLKVLNVSACVTSEAVQAMNTAVDPKLIRRGNRFVMLVETSYDDSGNKLPVGGVCALAFHDGKKWHAAYRFDYKGSSRFLNASGHGISSGRLIMPVSTKRMRISSRFGLRQHPIRGYTCQHKGVDLAAPIGTSVMAAADGVVAKAFYYGAYGKYVLIKHAGGYSTAYAHLSRMNVKAGDRVKQYQVIGAVGMTGSSTGPHLHFEAHAKGVHFNPLKSVSLPAEGLNREEMKAFQVSRNKFDSLLKI